MLQIQSLYQNQGGMFSKAGRYTSEKYMVFQKKDEIIGGKRKFLKPGSAPTLQKPKPESEPDVPVQIEKQAKQEDAVVPRRKKEEAQPFFKQTSREKIQSIKSVRHPPPPTGYYHPKFTGLDKAPHQLWDILRIQQKRTTSRKQTEEVGDFDEQLTKPIPERPQSYVKGSVVMSKHSIRNDLAMMDTINPHEGRFEYLNMNTTFSKIPRVPSADIAKQLGRYNAAIYKKQNFAPDYDPDYTVGKPRLDIGQTPFKRSLPRKDMTVRPQTSNENYFDYDHYYGSPQTNLFIQPKSINLQNQLVRDKDPKFPLPSFMQKHNNSRLQMDTLNHKMLELNHYMDGRFQSISSSFRTKRDLSRKKQRDEEVSIHEVAAR